MHPRFPVLAQRITRRSAVQLLGGAPLLATAALAAGPAAPRTPQPAGAARAADGADQLFQAGHFAAADAAYTQILAHEPHNLHALAQHGYLALLANRLDEARGVLERVVQAQPNDTLSLGNLAATLYRLDDFAHAAPVYHRLGQTRTARLLAGFGRRVPYEIQGPDTTRLPFLLTDPLPMVEVSVNGSRPEPFTLDTGAPGLVLSPRFAARAGVRQIAAGLGIADAVSIGEVALRNVPVSLGPATGPTAPLAPGGRPQQGVLGTALLSHFLFTLDYAQAALVLRRKTPAQLQQFGAQAHGAIAMPFWVAADHFMVAWGTLDRLAPMLFLIDSGGPGLGLETTQATAAAAGVKLDPSTARRVVLGIINGHANEATVIPFMVERLTLGAALNCDLPGLAHTSAAATPLRLGFTIGGTISHAFFRPFTVTFDFLGMQLFVSGAARSCGSDR